MKLTRKNQPELAGHFEAFSGHPAPGPLQGLSGVCGHNCPAETGRYLRDTVKSGRGSYPHHRGRWLTVVALLLLPLRIAVAAPSADSLSSAVTPVSPVASAADTVAAEGSPYAPAGSARTGSVALRLEDNSTKFKWTQLIAPAALITVGSLGVSTDFGIGIRETVRDVMEENRGPYRLPVDDMIQFVPLAMDLGLGLAGVKARHNFRDRAMVTFTAYATMAVLVNTLKYTVREPRPGGEVHNAFPSGHTAVAFTAAEIVRVEYGPWWGLAAYSVGCATAFLRVYNDRHWITDTVAGAGIGILSARVGYWMLPLEQRLADHITAKCRARRAARLSAEMPAASFHGLASDLAGSQGGFSGGRGSSRDIDGALWAGDDPVGKPSRRRVSFLAVPSYDASTRAASLSVALVF